MVTQTLLSTEFSYTFTSLIGGVSYEYKLIAANKYGQGPSSDPLVVLQSQVPDQPAAPTVTTSGLYVKISWTEPFTNYMPTTSYTILIKDSTGAFAEHPMICDGSSSFSMANNYCYI